MHLHTMLNKHWTPLRSVDEDEVGVDLPWADLDVDDPVHGTEHAEHNRK